MLEGSRTVLEGELPKHADGLSGLRPQTIAELALWRLDGGPARVSLPAMPAVLSDDRCRERVRAHLDESLSAYLGCPVRLRSETALRRLCMARLGPRKVPLVNQSELLRRALLPEEPRQSPLLSTAGYWALRLSSFKTYEAILAHAMARLFESPESMLPFSASGWVSPPDSFRGVRDAGGEPFPSTPKSIPDWKDAYRQYVGHVGDAALRKRAQRGRDAQVTLEVRLEKLVTPEFAPQLRVQLASEPRRSNAPDERKPDRTRMPDWLELWSVPTPDGVAELMCSRRAEPQDFLASRLLQREPRD